MELTFHAGKQYDDPFNQIEVDAVFTDPHGQSRKVPAFWAGGDVWKVRYSSMQTGKHSFRLICSDLADTGLNGHEGFVQIDRYRGDNPLFKHGEIRVESDKRHFQYADGTPFFWLGDTWWMGLAKRLHWPEDFKKLTADRVSKGFNVVQMVAGLYPDMPAFDPRGSNEAGFPWTHDYATINPAFFDKTDDRLIYLIDNGLMPCIVGAWGYFIPWMGVDKMKKQWRYLIARYASMPVIWCAAGEANLPFYTNKGFPYDDRDQVKQWTEVMRYIRKVDPFHRLLTIHPTAINQYTARHATDDPSLLDFDMLQTPHGRLEAAHVTVRAMHHSYNAQPRMPVIDGEAAFEMLSDNLPTEWTRAMFWICMMNGAAGHTYGANGIWQNNRPGDPHGASPWGGGYGKITWEEAMNLPGSTHVSLGKKLLERYPWQKFVPHPEWAVYVKAPSADTIDQPQSTGIDGHIRLSYCINPDPIVLQALKPKHSYRVHVFDPTTGAETPVTTLTSDGSGKLRFEPPAGWTHDWIAIVQ